MIENWGVNTFDDLHFLYLCDQGKIDGPSLTKRTAKDDGKEPESCSLPYRDVLLAYCNTAYWDKRERGLCSLGPWPW